MTSILAWFRARERVTDALTTVCVAVAEIVQATAVKTNVVNDDVIEPVALAHWALIVLTPLVVMIRRRYPLTAVTVGAVSTMAMWALDLPVTGLAGMFVLHAAVVYGPPKRGLHIAVGCATALIAWASLGIVLGSAPLYILPLVAWSVSIPILVGRNHNTNQQLLRVTQERLSDAEHRRQSDREAIVQAERQRVARELHDVVAHGLSVIVIQAGAGSRIVAKADPNDLADAQEKVGSVLETIDNAARRSLGDMRQVLGVLREDNEDESWRPTPGTMTITELVSQANADGLDVDFELDEDPPSLPSAVGASAYRIAQEALTNVRKHGGPGVRATLSARFGPEELVLTIQDNGRGAAAQASDVPGSGQGLVGMRERAELLGGTFQSGPVIGGGFQVRATLPLANED